MLLFNESQYFLNNWIAQQHFFLYFFLNINCKSESTFRYINIVECSRGIFYWHFQHMIKCQILGEVSRIHWTEQYWFVTAPLWWTHCTKLKYFLHKIKNIKQYSTGKSNFFFILNQTLEASVEMISSCLGSTCLQSIMTEWNNIMWPGVGQSVWSPLRS